jgi:hypothetical protein
MDKLENGIHSAQIEQAKSSKSGVPNDVAAHTEHLKKVSREQAAQIELLQNETTT